MSNYEVLERCNLLCENKQKRRQRKMASIVNRNGRYSVVYYYKDNSGNRKQLWVTQDCLALAKLRKIEIEGMIRNK